MNIKIETMLEGIVIWRGRLAYAAGVVCGYIRAMFLVATRKEIRRLYKKLKTGDYSVLGEYMAAVMPEKYKAL